MIQKGRRAATSALAVITALVLAGLGQVGLAQQRAYRVSDWQVETLLRRIETRTDSFRASLANSLDRGVLDSTRREENLDQYVADFEAATDRLQERFRNRQSVAADVEDVLNRAAYIDSFMGNRRLSYRAEQDWNMLRTDLNTLANYYNVSWRWDTAGYPAFNRLTGTYRLDLSRSDSTRVVAERATRGLSDAEQQRISNIISRRLEAPEMLALDQRGRGVTIASSRAPQATIVADGRDRFEQNRRGRQVRTNASLVGDRLTVSQTGDRGNDFSVTFEPMDNGRRLRVTRRMDLMRLGQPVTVTSVYNRTSDVAQLDIFNGRRDDVARDTIGVSGIPDNTRLVAMLEETIDTEQAREGDRVRLTVRSPRAYQGAVIEGYISDVERSGRFTGRPEVAFAFERIRMPNGRTYDFAGYIESVRTPDGDEVSVNNEDVVREEESQTRRTVTRAGIGAAIGAIIGAIAGGGEGAAIGAAIGAGAGAGSVILEGRGDLELERGTEMVIRTQASRIASR